MMAPMGKGTRAAGNRRRASAPAQSAQAAPQGGQPPRQQPPSPAPRAAEGRSRSGRGATFSVLMMTIAALAGVGVLAAQAEATAPKVRAVGTSASSAKESTGSGSKAGTSATSSTALPANSGHGTRIVYSPSAHRVWLVENSTVERTMRVVPGTITPSAGTFTVYSKTPGSLGSDNVTVLYVVKFDSSSSDSNTFGFDAESGVTGLPPAPKGRTGGVRMTQGDAQLLYEFASVGTTVVVV